MSLPLLKSVICFFKTRTAMRADCRSERFVAVIDCVLNQNVRDQGAASFPGMNFDLLQLCHDQHIGIMQMPCPEIFALGFRRERPSGTTIRQALDSEVGRQRCADLASSVAERVQAALAGGSRLLAVLGGNSQSPGCAVHDGERGLLPESGIFLQALQQELQRRGIIVPFIGLRDASAQMLAEDLQSFRQLLGSQQA